MMARIAEPTIDTVKLDAAGNDFVPKSVNLYGVGRYLRTGLP